MTSSIEPVLPDQLVQNLAPEPAEKKNELGHYQLYGEMNKGQLSIKRGKIIKELIDKEKESSFRRAQSSRTRYGESSKDKTKAKDSPPQAGPQTESPCASVWVCG